MSRALTTTNGGGRGRPPTAPAGMVEDLERFGLTPEDIDARHLTHIDLEGFGLNTAIVGYRIPYHDIKGVPLKHSRIRALPRPGEQGDGLFIRTVKDVTRVYFPPAFEEAREAAREVKLSAAETPNGELTIHRPLIVVDDERMAARIQKHNKYLSVAIQGVSGWRTQLGLAEGFKELCELSIEEGYTLVLWLGDGEDRNIQREVANIAMEMKFCGVPFRNIRQYIGNTLYDADLKDVLIPLSAFPRHPGIRQYILSKIEEGQRLSRKDHQEIALAVLSDLESGGFRIRSTTTGDYFYFDRRTKELVSASLAVSGRELMENSDFMSSIYTRYGLSPQDRPILSWFSTQFMAEEPVYRTKSYRVMMCEPRHENSFALQVSDSAFIHFAHGKQATLRENGDFGILFERGQVKSVDTDALLEEIEKQRKNEVMPMWWRDVVGELRLPKDDRFKLFLSALYYISPWLKGWKEIQLPIEVITGEAGTGKSSLFSLRLGILTGHMKLERLPPDLREWSAKVASTSGMVVFDNVHLANKVIRQTLSDEMCRLVTEPMPTISMRQLYKTAEVADFPVQCTFALTSIENVFTNIDFIQRSVIVQLERPYTSEGDEVLYGGWVQQKLNERGGREAWLAHHIVVLERFFEEARNHWRPDYQSKTRLINFEQTVMLMGRVFGVDMSWLPNMLRDVARDTAIEIDWVLEGLARFAEERRGMGESGRTFSAQDIEDWADASEDFDKNATLTSSRRVGRYIATHRTIVRQTTGIVVMPAKRGATYAIDRTPETRLEAKRPERKQSNSGASSRGGGSRRSAWAEKPDSEGEA